MRMIAVLLLYLILLAQCSIDNKLGRIAKHLEATAPTTPSTNQGDAQ